MWCLLTNFNFSQGSDPDSLDENVVSSGDLINCSDLQQTIINRAQNVYQTLPPAPPARKLETTELWLTICHWFDEEIKK